MGLVASEGQVMARKHELRLEAGGDQFEMFDAETGELLGLGEGELWSLNDVKQFCDVMERGSDTGVYQV